MPAAAEPLRLVETRPLRTPRAHRTGSARSNGSATSAVHCLAGAGLTDARLNTAVVLSGGPHSIRCTAERGGREAQGQSPLPWHTPRRSELIGAGMFSCRQAGRQAGGRAGRRARGRAGLRQALRSSTVPEQAVVGHAIDCAGGVGAEVHVTPAPHVLDAGCTTQDEGRQGELQGASIRDAGRPAGGRRCKQLSAGANRWKQPPVAPAGAAVCSC